MGFYEAKRDGVAKKLLTKFGVTMQLRVTSNEDFDPVIGEVTGGATKNHPVKAVVLTKKRSEKNDLAVREGYLDLMVAASGLKVVPTTSDKILYNSIEYDIVTVIPISPAGVDVVYQMSVKQP